MIGFLSLTLSKMNLSLSVNSSLEFNTTMIRLALSIKDRLFSTPIFSAKLSVSLIPAVSIKESSIPSKIILPSTISLVVPSISVTIALSSFKNLFKILLFPTLGLPIIIVLIPFLIICLSSDFVTKFFKSFSRLVITSFNSFLVTSSIS